MCTSISVKDFDKNRHLDSFHIKPQVQFMAFTIRSMAGNRNVAEHGERSEDQNGEAAREKANRCDGCGGCGSDEIVVCRGLHFASPCLMQRGRNTTLNSIKWRNNK